MEAIEKHAPTKGDRFARRNFLNAIGVDMDENIPVDAPIAVKEKAITEAARKEQQAAAEFMRWQDLSEKAITEELAARRDEELRVPFDEDLEEQK